jgi:hypothetical protein
MSAGEPKPDLSTSDGKVQKQGAPGAEGGINPL